MTIPTTSRVDPQAIRRARRLVDVLAGYGVHLRPNGPGTFKAHCPFHDDKHPSLTVYECDQHFHCYGCGLHGDVIDFVALREGIGFREACRRLADQVPIPVDTNPPPERRHEARRWDRLGLEEQVVMNVAAALYHRRLWQEPRALAYLHDRGIPEWLVRQCALGYADGHSLEAFLRRRFGLKVAQDLGLLRRPHARDNGRSLAEFFARRIVVPEIRAGQCIWLIGRSIEDDQAGPKYLALSGERPVLGHERVAGQREAFLCEGVFDLLTAVSWKLPAFSPCGTSLPAERLGFLARVRTVYGVLDGDAAGQAAAERFGQQLGSRWRPLRLPDGCDLNDLGRRADGRATFFGMLAEARRAAGEKADA